MTFILRPPPETLGCTLQTSRSYYAQSPLIEVDRTMDLNSEKDITSIFTSNNFSESTIHLMCLLNGCDIQDFNHLLVFEYPVKSYVRSRNMQAVNVFVVLSPNYLFVALSWKWIIRECFAFFNHYPLAFWWQCINELQGLFIDN